jgi:dTDP-4-amino-4,6-dideoxygalactose transaminase
MQPFYRERYGYQPQDFPNAWAASQQVVSLPIYPRMTDRDVDDVVAAVREALEGSRT